MKEYLSDKQVKENLTKMLKEVDAFLEDNNITYTIFAGTLLGAVRHKGFIPWDDDIDIALKRCEYNKLLDILRTNNSVSSDMYATGFELGNGELPFIKFEKKDIFVAEKVYGGDERMGNLWIDVFPMDEVPLHGQKLFFKAYENGLRKFHRIKRMELTGWQIASKHKFVTGIERLLLLPISYNRITQWMINYSQKRRNNHRYLCDVVWGVGERGIVRKELFDDITEYAYENITVKGIRNADEWLTTIYGDYMKLPPESEQVSHGLTAWIEKK